MQIESQLQQLSLPLCSTFTLFSMIHILFLCSMVFIFNFKLNCLLFNECPLILNEPKSFMGQTLKILNGSGRCP